MTSPDSPAAANKQLIERFYAAFAAGDGEAMAACYAPDAHSPIRSSPTSAAPSRGRCGGC